MKCILYISWFLILLNSCQQQPMVTGGRSSLGSVSSTEANEDEDEDEDEDSFYSSGTKKKKQKKTAKKSSSSSTSSTSAGGYSINRDEEPEEPEPIIVTSGWGVSESDQDDCDPKNRPSTDPKRYNYCEEENDHLTDESEIKAFIAIRKAIASQIGPDCSCPEIFAVLDRVTEINISKQSLEHLGPISALTGLKTLDASQNEIKDISALGLLKQLGYLDISNNKVSSLNPLATLSRLKTLKASDNKIQSVSALAAISTLEQVDVSNNYVKSIVPLLRRMDDEDNPLTVSYSGNAGIREERLEGEEYGDQDCDFMGNINCALGESMGAASTLVP